MPENPALRTTTSDATAAEARTGYCWCVSRSPQGVGVARQVARDCLRRWGEDDARTEQAALVLTELVTNTVQHSSSRTTTIWCRLRRVGTGLLVEIWDRTFRAPVPEQHARADDETDPAMLSEHGRGLILVGALSTNWGIRPHSAGCTVWARM